MKTGFIFILILLYSLTISRSMADLSWDKSSIEVNAGGGAAQVDASFKYLNKSKGKIFIMGHSTSCGCTVAEISESVVNSGAGGDVHVVYTPGDAVGAQRKEIIIQCMDENGAKFTDTLELLVNIESPIKLSPEYLDLQSKDLDQKKIVSIDVLPDAKIDSIEFVSTNSLIAGNVERSGNKYTLNLIVMRGYSGVTQGQLVVTYGGGNKKTIEYPIVLETTS